MCRITPHARLQVMELEGRVTPTTLAPSLVWHTGAAEGTAQAAALVNSDGSAASSAHAPAPGHIEEIPLQVSLAGLAVIALSVCWDHHTRQRRPALRSKFAGMLTAR
jgi:hypothetical protein